MCIGSPRSRFDFGRTGLRIAIGEMVRRNAFINKLPAVETLGTTRVIFTDKTGTFTENRMTLRQVSTPADDFTFDEENKQVEGPNGRNGAKHPLLRRVIEIGVMCNNASLRDEDQDMEPEEEQGDPTETALLRAGLVLRMDRGSLLSEKPEEREVSFDSEQMMMAAYNRTKNGFEVAVKGAPARVLSLCTHVAQADGNADSFLTLAFGKLWFVYNLRNRGSRMFTNDIVRNPYVAGSIVLCAALLVAAVYVPVLSGILKTQDPGPQGWMLLLGMSLIPFVSFSLCAARGTAMRKSKADHTISAPIPIPISTPFHRISVSVSPSCLNPEPALYPICCSISRCTTRDASLSPIRPERTDMVVSCSPLDSILIQ